VGASDESSHKRTKGMKLSTDSQLVVEHEDWRGVSRSDLKEEEESGGFFTVIREKRTGKRVTVDESVVLIGGEKKRKNNRRYGVTTMKQGQAR